MAKLDDTPLWTDVYQLEQTDPVIGGTPNPDTGAGMDNIPHLQLAQRTSWLKEAVDTLTTAVVAATTTVAGLVKLSTATNSTSTTTAATPSAVKAVNDNAETRALKSTTFTAGDGLTGGGSLGGNRSFAVDASVVRGERSVTGSGLATGGGDLNEDRVITVLDATKAEAEAGTITSKAMSPLRVAQAIAATIAAYVPSARTITAGDGLSGGGSLSADRTITVPAATQAEAEASISTSKAMTPKGVAQAMAQFGIVDGNCPQADNLDTLTLNGFFRTSNTTIGAPDIGSSYDAVGVAINGAGQKTQIMSLSSDLMCMRVDDGSGWGDWLTLLHGGPVAGSSSCALDQRMASQAEATAGNSNDKLMTPLRTKQAVVDQTVGLGQSWVDVSGTRSGNTSYQNTTGRPIMLAIRASNSGYVQVSTNGSAWVTVATCSGANPGESFVIVPPGHYYRMTASAIGGGGFWAELR